MFQALGERRQAVYLVFVDHLISMALVYPSLLLRFASLGSLRNSGC